MFSLPSKSREVMEQGVLYKCILEQAAKAPKYLELLSNTPMFVMYS